MLSPAVTISTKKLLTSILSNREIERGAKQKPEGKREREKEREKGKILYLFMLLFLRYQNSHLCKPHHTYTVWAVSEEDKNKMQRTTKRERESAREWESEWKANLRLRVNFMAY